MGHQKGPWDNHPVDDIDERELADLPSGAARWVVIALAMWMVIIAIGIGIYLSR